MSENVKPKLLIVTDDPNQLLALSEFLGYEYHALTARDGDEGYSVLSQYKRRMNLLITELRMLKRTGLTLLTKAKQEYTSLQILVVKYVESEPLSEYLSERRVISYLEEPFTYDQLKKKIDDALKIQLSQPGELQPLELLDLIQLYCLSQAKIALTVVRKTETTEERGKVYFEDGKIVNAVYRDKRGEDALYEMLAWEFCRFFPRYSVVAKQKAIRRQWEDLLLIGFQRVQEQMGGHPQTGSVVRSAEEETAGPAPLPTENLEVQNELSVTSEPLHEEERVSEEIEQAGIDPQFREAIQHILQELYEESENLQNAIVINTTGQVVSALKSESFQIESDIFNTLLWKIIQFSEQIRHRLDLGELNEMMVFGEYGGIVVMYPIKNFGVLGVTTLKESQGMVRWNCTEALSKIQKLLQS